MPELMAPREASRRRSVPRLIVVVGPCCDDVEIERAAGGGWLVCDARTEDAFVGIEQLLGQAACASTDLIVCLGARTLTGDALALILDAPLATTRTLAPKRLASLGAAVETGSEMRCAVMDVRVDGVRRFALQHIDVTGSGLAVDGGLVHSTYWSPQRGPLRLSCEGSASDAVIIHDGGGGHARGHPVTVTGTGAEVGIRGHRQRFERLDVEVRASPLRQIVVGTPSQRRSVADTVPL